MEMAYNMILGRLWIHEMDVVPSTLHQVVKFPSPWGIRQIRGDQQTSKSINSVADLTLIKQDQFKWSEECQQAPKNLKAYLSNPSLLAKPKDGERLLIYLVVSEVAVSAILVREDQDRLGKWAIDLSEYDITYQPSTAIKSQVLGDFLADFSQKILLEAEKELQVFNGSNPGTWTLFTDGSSNVKGAGLGLVLIPPAGETIRQAIKCHPITNNKAEYEAVIAGLELAHELGINQIVIKSDSQLVVNQMLGFIQPGKHECSNT
ncbi:uncharacterized protein LOC142170408 [Nicotiana tabacum]|uniref:Uncharacterized protein LOC142170408 n=1 Tax=Nicotiana tabacum TaxID=4097 RepID=A0AC58STV0_TOBAC